MSNRMSSRRAADEQQVSTNKNGKNVKKEREGDRNRPTPTVFVRPSLEEAQTYFLQENLNGDPAKFHSHYAAVGWKKGRTPITDWHAAARGWSIDEPKFSARGTGTAPQQDGGPIQVTDDGSYAKGEKR